MAHWFHIEFNNSVSHMATVETDCSGLQGNYKNLTVSFKYVPLCVCFQKSIYNPWRQDIVYIHYLWAVSHCVSLKQANSRLNITCRYGYVSYYMIGNRLLMCINIAVANFTNYHWVPVRSACNALQHDANKHLLYHISNIFSPFECYRILQVLLINTSLFRVLRYADKNVSCAT